MPKAYRAKRDVSFPRVLSRGEDGVEVTEGVNYTAGQPVPHDSLPEFVKGGIEDGRFEHLLDPLDDNEAEDALAGVVDDEYGIFVPEHEAEATALMAAGKGIVPKDQALESLSASAQHHADYQNAAREAGLDHRPVQEHLAQLGTERVPDEVLYGAETPAGMPHDRGPVQTEEDNSEERSEEEAPAVRPSPPVQGGNVGAEVPDRGNSDSESEERVGEA